MRGDKRTWVNQEIGMILETGILPAWDQTENKNFPPLHQYEALYTDPQSHYPEGLLMTLWALVSVFGLPHET